MRILWDGGSKASMDSPEKEKGRKLRERWRQYVQFEVEIEVSINLNLFGRLWMTPVPTVIKVTLRWALLTDANCRSLICVHPDAADETTPVPGVIPKLRARTGTIQCKILVLSIEVETVSETSSLWCCIVLTISNPAAHKNDNKAFFDDLCRHQCTRFHWVAVFTRRIIWNEKNIADTISSILQVRDDTVPWPLSMARSATPATASTDAIYLRMRTFSNPSSPEGRGMITICNCVRSAARIAPVW